MCLDPCNENDDFHYHHKRTLVGDRVEETHDRSSILSDMIGNNNELVADEALVLGRLFYFTLFLQSAQHFKKDALSTKQKQC